jgi:hypothetical protein
MQVGGQEFEGPARRRIPGEHRRVPFARHNAGLVKDGRIERDDHNLDDAGDKQKADVCDAAKGENMPG